MALKDRIIELRKENGWTQKQVAEILKMSPTGYASWEQGLSEPSTAQIKILCKLYKVTSDYLLELADN